MEGLYSILNTLLYETKQYKKKLKIYKMNSVNLFNAKYYYTFVSSGIILLLVCSS